MQFSCSKFKVRSVRNSREKLHAQAISSMFSFLFADEFFCDIQNTIRQHFSLFNIARDHENDDIKTLLWNQSSAAGGSSWVSQALVRRFPWSTW